MNLRCVSLAVALMMPAVTLQGQTACGSADGHSVNMIGGLRHIMGAAPHLVAERTQLHIPLVDRDSITLVTNDSICAVMAAAYGASIGTAPPGPVYVVKVGTVYLVRDATYKAGEYLVDMVISTQGTVLARVLG